jgi:hypothetical protein
LRGEGQGEERGEGGEAAEAAEDGFHRKAKDASRCGGGRAIF